MHQGIYQQVPPPIKKPAASAKFSRIARYSRDERYLEDLILEPGLRRLFSVYYYLLPLVHLLATAECLPSSRLAQSVRQSRGFESCHAFFASFNLPSIISPAFSPERAIGSRAVFRPSKLTARLFLVFVSLPYHLLTRQLLAWPSSLVAWIPRPQHRLIVSTSLR